MAFCPKCNGVLDSDAIACPHCGYDFPLSKPVPQRGFADSPLADLALVFGIVAAGLGCTAAAIASVSALAQGRIEALIVGPVAFFLQLAMLVVFVRVRRI